LLTCCHFFFIGAMASRCIALPSQAFGIVVILVSPCPLPRPRRIRHIRKFGEGGGAVTASPLRDAGEDLLPHPQVVPYKDWRRNRRPDRNECRIATH
jgi:hypothetical protein